MKYIYNPDRGTLHIEGYCYYAKINNPSYLVFDTENEAISKGKTKLKWCQNCLKRRDEKLKEKKHE